ncbi:MAG: translation initiation factor IF-2 [Rickettsiales bacterium]
MTNKDNKSDTLTVNRPNKTTLSLTKTVDSGKVQQKFTHGRSKSVTVEVKKTRTFARNSTGGMEEVQGRKPQEEDNQPQQNPNQPVTSFTAQRGPMLNILDAQVRDKNQIERAGSQVVTARDKERERGNTVVGPNERQDKNKSNITRPAQQQQQQQAPGQQPLRPEIRRPPVIEDEEAAAVDPKKTGKIRLKEGARRQSNKITVAQALEYQEERIRSLASVRRQREKARRAEGPGDVQGKIFREVVVPETITVSDLANRMAERVNDVIMALMKMGTMATVSQSIDADTAELIIHEFGHKIKRVTEDQVENILIEEKESEENLLPRAPVVTIMGHVDHGKTSLLDALRDANVVAGEAGGITQHIGAYQVERNGQKITFLDTPGHEAFTAMRSRGAKATDIVVLVVAADDGIMAQTEEAIAHARAAGVPIIVAVNKIDKPEADPKRIKTELMQHELVAEEFGGDIQVIEVSAKQKMNLDKLEEAILLQAEILELKANPNRKATGVVIEAQIDKGRGAVATFLVQKGTLNVGDIVVAGASWGKIRAISDDKGQSIKTAIPSQPVSVLGLNEPPLAGDAFAVVENEKTARDITEYRSKKERDRLSVATAKSLDQLFVQASDAKVKELPLIIKGDVQGSVEAIIGSVSKFNGEEVAVKVIHSGVGGINESDISLAQATGAIVFGFNVRATSGARTLADKEKIDIRYYSIIYDLVDDVKAALSGLLSPEKRENLLGYAEVRQIFNISKIGKVAGCMVTEGMIKRGAKVRLLRDNVVIHEGTLKTLKRFKDEEKEVKYGFECGMAFENYDDVREGDQIEAFEVEEIARSV